MNATAKQINQMNFFSGQLVDMRFSKTAFLQSLLLAAVLLSALLVVYVTNMYRVTVSQLQLASQTAQQLQLQWGQLLLEQASMVTPARVQTVAIEKLHMVFPTDKQAYVLRIK